MKATYEFIHGEKYGEVFPVVVLADNYKEALSKAVAAIKGSNIKEKELKLGKIVEFELQTAHQVIEERRMLIEERSSNFKVEHSGTINEIRTNKTSAL